VGGELARERLGRFGVWRTSSDVTPVLAVGLERQGFGAVWLGGSPSGDLRHVDTLLGATTTLVVATGIVNVWNSDAREVATSFARIEGGFPGRFLLGVGVGHRESTSEYARPYDTLASYVEVLRQAGVPRDSLVLAALGPKVLRLAADRTAGAHPYLVTPEHTRLARGILGDGALLAPEHKVVLDPDLDRGRGIGRDRVEDPYLGLSNYTNNLRRLGWSDSDLGGHGSDALIDALVAHGDDAQVAAQLHAHLDAGADHVAVQLLGQSGADPLEGYGRLARALALAPR
jgi:probable F420-dependent oxidoreductase